MTTKAEDFYKQVLADLIKAMYESSGQRLIVASVTGGLVRVNDVRGQPKGVHAYIGVEKLVAGDEVWAEPVGNLHVDRNSMTALQSFVIIGKVHRTASTIRLIDGTELTLVGGMDLSGASDAAGASKTWTIDGATGAASFGSINTPISAILSQGSSDTGSTTSTVTYQTAGTMDLGLSNGTWTVKAAGFLAAKHSASTGVNMLVQIDGIDGGAKTLDCPAATFRLMTDNGEIGGVVGNRTIQIRIRFKSSDAGTTTANNPLLLAVATRTS